MISLNQSLIYENLFPPTPGTFICLPLLNSATKKTILRYKNNGGNSPPCPHTPSYAHDSIYTNLRGVVCHKIGILTLRLHKNDQPENAV